jgi:hypothetical protein
VDGKVFDMVTAKVGRKSALKTALAVAGAALLGQAAREEASAACRNACLCLRDRGCCKAIRKISPLGNCITTEYRCGLATNCDCQGCPY